MNAGVTTSEDIAKIIVGYLPTRAKLLKEIRWFAGDFFYMYEGVFCPEQKLKWAQVIGTLYTNKIHSAEDLENPLTFQGLLTTMHNDKRFEPQVPFKITSMKMLREVFTEIKRMYDEECKMYKERKKRIRPSAEGRPFDPKGSR